MQYKRPAYPFRLAALRQATFPKGTAFAAAGNFAAAPKGVPLGELPNEVRLRGCGAQTLLAISSALRLGTQ